MKTEKMSFRNINDVLSRDEMKSIMAGSDEFGYCGYCNGAACYRNIHGPGPVFECYCPGSYIKCPVPN